MLCVPPAYVPELWPHARPLIARAFMAVAGDDTIESTEAALRSGEELLWIVWGDGRIMTAATTVLIRVPRAKICLVKAAAGAGMGQWMKFMAKIEEYARAEGCDLIRVAGRRGWARVLPDFEQPWIVLQKSLGS